MSWHSDHRQKPWTSRLCAAVLAIAILPALAGCGSDGFSPLYGVNANGGSVAAEMERVDVASIPGRVGQQVRNELLFRATGGSGPIDPAYRLNVILRESVRSTLVDVDGDSLARIYSLTAEFQVIRLSDNSVILAGQGHANAAFQHLTSIFSNTRARRDAENRAARDLATSLRTRIAARLSRTT